MPIQLSKFNMNTSDKDMGMELIDQSKLDSNHKASIKVSSQAYERITKRNEIEKNISEFKNNPIKIFAELNLPVTYIDEVSVKGSGFQKTYTWNNKEYKRPELVAKAYYESLGYLVTWSEGVAWGMFVKAIMSLLTINFSKNFEAIDTRESELKIALEVNEIKGVPPEESKRKVEDRYAERIKKLKGEDGLIELGVRSIMKSIFDKDEYSYTKTLSVFKLKAKHNFTELYKILMDDIEKVSKEKDVEAAKVYFPKVGDRVFSEYTDKRNLNEWSIKFAEDILINMKWVTIYHRLFERSGTYEARYDLTLINYEQEEVKFVEVKVNDNFTEFQLDDLVNAVQYTLPVELAVIKVNK